MRAHAWLLVLTLMGAQPSWGADPSPPPNYRAPDTQGVCPAIAEDFLLCSDNPWSGNCAPFVVAADRLGEVYRSEVREHPGWADELKTTIWWGCGSAHLAGLRSLLERIGTPKARAVLAKEPYTSLSEPRAAPSPPPPPDQELDCVTPETADERNACAARNLAQAKARHAQAFGACNQRVAPALRQQLLDADTSWEKLLPLECGGVAYTRDECLARAYDERTQSMHSMHPECDTVDSE